MNQEIQSSKAVYWKLVFPLLIEQVFVMLITNVNVFLLSLYNDEAVAATGIADQVLLVGMVAMGIVSLGRTILFLQYADNKYLTYLQAVARQTMLLNTILGVGIFVITLILGDAFIKIMQTPAELTDMTSQYLRIVSSSLIFQGISTSVSALLRSYGKVNQAMRISIMNTFLVITGNAVVILGLSSFFNEGVLGISLSMVLTRFIGAMISILAVRKYLPQIWEKLLVFKVSDFKVGRRILELGIPSGMENVSYNVSQVIITAVIASFGTVAINAKIYTQTTTAIVFTISIAAGQALQILLGKLVRERKYDTAHQMVLDMVLRFILIGILINIVIALFGGYIARVFTGDPEIIALVKILLWLSIFYEPMRMTNEMLIASLNLIGDVKYPVRVGIMVIYLFTVPMSLLLGGYFNLGITVIWLIFILDEGFRAYLFYKRWNAKKNDLDGIY